MVADVVSYRVYPNWFDKSASPSSKDSQASRGDLDYAFVAGMHLTAAAEVRVAATIL